MCGVAAFARVAIKNMDGVYRYNKLGIYSCSKHKMLIRPLLAGV